MAAPSTSSVDSPRFPHPLRCPYPLILIYTTAACARTWLWSYWLTLLNQGALPPGPLIRTVAHLPACLIIQHGALSTSSPLAARTISGSCTATWVA